MNNHLSDVAMPGKMPELATMRRGMMMGFSPEQLAAIAAWLGMEAVERESDEVFQVGKLALGYSELGRSQGGDSIDFNEGWK